MEQQLNLETSKFESLKIESLKFQTLKFQTLKFEISIFVSSGTCHLTTESRGENT